MTKTLLGLLCLVVAPLALGQDAPPPYAPALGIDPDLPLNRVTWLTTHNAFNHDHYLLPGNQTYSIDRQLGSGVRGLMLDLHPRRDGLYLCHGTCLGGEQTFAALLRDTILPFLRATPSSVLTLHLEDHENRDELIAELSRVDGLAEVTFDPDKWKTPEWPTYRQLIESGQRLLIFSQNRDNSGPLPTSSGRVHVMFDQYYTVENHWSLGGSIFDHDDSCASRWDNVSLTTPFTIYQSSWPRLFVMNHFHGFPAGFHSSTDNSYDVLRDRVDRQCEPAAGHRPNTIAVDDFAKGQAKSVVAALNAGTLELFDGADGTGKRICAIHAGWRREVVNDNEKGDFCTPYARSAVLRDVPAGTSYELDDGNRGGPRITIIAKRDLAGESVTIRDFESDQEENGVSVKRANGGTLSERIYRAKVKPAR